MSDIRNCFTSRFGKYGVIIEADFSQLEVVALAFLSQDKTLISDITNGLDMHLVSASWVTGVPYEDLKKSYDAGDPHVASVRKAAKRPRFELQYGATAPTIAKNNNWPLNQAQNYINRYYDRYPEVRVWQDMVAATVEANKIPAKGFVSSHPEYIGWYTCPHTQRRYVFKTSSKYGKPRFSPTQMKNYPVQGFATADFVPTILGELCKYLYSIHSTDNTFHEKYCVINTVHDSILLDVHLNHAEYLRFLIREVLDRSVSIFKEVFNVEINVPIKYTISQGRSWGELKEVKYI